jgi:hypothetical protein
MALVGTHAETADHLRALTLELTDTVVMALGSPPGQRVTHHITMIRTESPSRCAARLSSRAAATP